MAFKLPFWVISKNRFAGLLPSGPLARPWGVFLVARVLKVLPLRYLHYRAYFYIICFSSSLSFLSQPGIIKSCWHCDFNSQIFFSRTDFSCIISFEVKGWMLPCLEIWGDVLAGKSGVSVSVLWELCAYASFQVCISFTWLEVLYLLSSLAS